MPIGQNGVHCTSQAQRMFSTKLEPLHSFGRSSLELELFRMLLIGSSGRSWTRSQLLHSRNHSSLTAPLLWVESLTIVSFSPWLIFRIPSFNLRQPEV